MSDAPQRVCPHCARISYETGRRCPWCGRRFARHVLPAAIAVALLCSALVLGGVYLMLDAFGRELDRRLDTQVERVQRDLVREMDGVRGDVRRELDRRLPPAP
jgi:hypothetical protein